MPDFVTDPSGSTSFTLDPDPTDPTGLGNFQGDPFNNPEDPFGLGEPGDSGTGEPGGGGGNPFTDFFKNPDNIFSLINAGIAAFSGIRDAKARNEAIAFTKQQLENARRLAGPDNFLDIVSRLQPMFRELVAQGLGPQFQQNLQGNLARRGLIGTGVGTALSNVGESIPGVTAFSGAQREAGRIQEGQVGAELGFPAIAPRTDPFSEALVRGATAFFTTRTGGQPSGGTGSREEDNELFPTLGGTGGSTRF